MTPRCPHLNQHLANQTGISQQIPAKPCMQALINIPQQSQQQLTLQAALRSLEARIAHEVARLDQDRQ
eukprot:961870-Pelagomonas_calceolata.AAC.3